MLSYGYCSGVETMNAYHFLIIVQIVALSIGFFGLYSLFCTMLRAESKFLLGASACAVVYGTGYLMEMLSTNLDMAFSAVCVQYCGLSYLALLFAIYLSKSSGVVSLPSLVWKLTFVYETITLLLVLSSRYHHLYYRSLSFTQEGLFPHMEEKGTVLLWIFMVHLAVLNVFCCFVAVKMLINSLSTKKKWIYQGIFAATIGTILAMTFSMLSGFSGYEAISALLLLILGVIAIVKTSGRTSNPVEMAYAEAFQRSKAAIVVLDEEYCYLESNDAAREVYPELSRQESGTRFTHINEIMRSIRDDRRIRVGNRYFKPYYYNLHDEKNKPLGFVFCLPDVTESEKKVQELAELKKAADEANEAKSIFLANMSHEMRTPLNAIIGLAELAQREETVGGLKEYLPQILNSGQILLDLISDVLDFSQAESGKVEIIPVEYDLKELLNTVVNIVAFRLGDKDIDFIVDADPTIPCRLIGDDARVRQIILNFLTNAVKYTDNGFIRFCVDWEDLGSRMLLKIAVSDSGRGIKREDIGKLFTVFSRLDLKNNRNIQGSGLGLAICAQLIKLMNGTYRVESEYGSGSTFYCILPQKIADHTPLSDTERKEQHFSGSRSFTLYASDEEHDRTQTGLMTRPEKDVKKSEEESLRDVQDPKQKERVLLVDDNPVNIKVLKAMLKAFAIEADVALSGPEAIRKLSKDRYDLILMDHMMPEMDGIETTGKIRSLEVPWAQTVTIIACTANAVKGAQQMFLESGMNDYLCKPVKLAELEAILKKWLKEPIEEKKD